MPSESWQLAITEIFGQKCQEVVNKIKVHELQIQFVKGIYFKDDRNMVTPAVRKITSLLDR